MQIQRSSDDLARADDDAERVVLTLLLDSHPRGWWSVQELAREVGAELRTTDAIARLQAAGLLHRCHEFVWPTRSAVRFNQLVGTP